MVTRTKASNKDLFDDVINNGMCTLCGACSGACPYMVPYRGKIVLVDNCVLTEGQCYEYCPRTYTDFDALSQKLFSAPYDSQELGHVLEVIVARSTDEDIRAKAQYGGTVTALLETAISEKLIDGAILSRMAEDKTPEAVFVKNKKELLKCAGSNYMACPSLKELNSQPKDSKSRLAVVTTPCQGMAIAKMKATAPRNRFNIDNVKLVIGLFCTWALSPDEFHAYLEKSLKLSGVTKFDIPPPPANRFDSYTKKDKTSFPLDDIRKFIMPGCALCTDMTSEFADVSVGAVEGLEGWNTVIVRTKAGADMIDLAKAKGKLETAKLKPENLAHLKEAALIKKKRALNNIINKSGSKNNLLYLGMPQSVVDKFLG
jgi:coenzyme F420 hydrogenase subunit beta